MAEQGFEEVREETRTRNTTTEYIVLHRSQEPGDDRVWLEFTDEHPQAKSRRDAIAQATASLDDKSGTYVAVPMREWKPMSRKVETKQVESWE